MGALVYAAPQFEKSAVRRLREVAPAGSRDVLVASTYVLSGLGTYEPLFGLLSRDNFISHWTPHEMMASPGQPVPVPSPLGSLCPRA
jgi:hypothetical protein